MDLVVDEEGGAADRSRTNRATRSGTRSRRHRRIKPYAWLAAGAVGVGVATAFTGSGIAYADDTAGASAASSSKSADGVSASTGPASGDVQEKSNGASRDTSTDGKSTSDDDSTSDDSADTATDVKDADPVEPAASDADAGSDVGNADPSEASAGDADAESDPDVEAPAQPAPITSKDSGRSGSRGTAADDPADVASSRANSVAKSRTTSSTVAERELAEDAAPIADDVADHRSGTAEPSTGPAATLSDTEPATAQAGASETELSVAVLETASSTALPQAPATPRTLVGLLTALFVRLQSTFFSNVPTAKPVQNTGQSSEDAVTGTVGATDPEGGPLAAELSAAGATPTVPSKYDAGLSDPFVLPDVSSGKTLNVRDYGATSNNLWDNDASAIQKAINAAQAGDVVYIPNGRYHIKTTINLKSGVSILGQSRDGTVLASAFTTSPHAMIYGAPGVTNLALSSFKITRASGRTIKAGVRLGLEGSATVSRIAVKNLSIEKFERFGVLLQNAYQVLVEGSVIKNATAVGGGGQGYGIIIDQSLSSNNWIRNNDIGPVIRHAILIQESAHNNLIEQNRVTGTVSGAIDLHGEDEYANEIRYNTISNGVRNGTRVSPNGAGIEVGEYSGVIGTDKMHDNSGPGNWIHHNTVYNYSFGLRIMNNSNYTFIEDNIFHDNRGAGIQADPAPLNNLYISGNQIYKNGSGIMLYDVTRVVVKDNVVRDNKRYGIWLNPGTTGYTVTGNTVTNSGKNVTLGSKDGTYVP